VVSGTSRSGHSTPATRRDTHRRAPKRTQSADDFADRRNDGFTVTDPDLALVNAAWDRLPEAVKAGIVAMVKAAAK
jgi:hypothetical protein